MKSSGRFVFVALTCLASAAAEAGAQVSDATPSTRTRLSIVVDTRQPDDDNAGTSSLEAQLPATMGKLQRYRLVLLISIVLNLVVGVWIFVSPETFTGLLDQPDAVPSTWPRHWGAQLWAINFLYLPGYRDPLTHRWPNWCGIAIRILFALFFLSQGDGFIPMGIYDGLSGLMLLATYLPVVRSAGRPS